MSFDPFVFKDSFFMLSDDVDVPNEELSPAQLNNITVFKDIVLVLAASIEDGLDH